MVYMLGSSPLTRGKQPTQALRPVGEFDHYVKRTPGCPFGQSRCPRCRAILLSEWTAFLTPMCDIVSLGIIPARAGETLMVAVSPSPETAHPRSRGENRALRERLSCLGGSSPLARGKLVRPLLGGVGDRLIPARAGKTFMICAIQG